MTAESALRAVLKTTGETGFPVSEQECAVLSNNAVNREYFHLVLEAPEQARSLRAGHFCHLLCPSSEQGTPFLRRPMSVYRFDAGSGQIEFLYKNAGLGTFGLTQLKPGETLNILGPLGNGFSIPGDTQYIVVLGRGVGLATLAPLAELAASRNISVTAILSARTPDLLMSADLFRETGAEVIAVTDEDGSSAVEHVESIIESIVWAGRAGAFYTCGSNRLFLMLQRLGVQYAIPGEVALEQQMACGLGMCFCCVRSFRDGDEIIQRRVCSEGPVFDIQAATGW